MEPYRHRKSQLWERSPWPWQDTTALCLPNEIIHAWPIKQSIVIPYLIQLLLVYTIPKLSGLYFKVATEMALTGPADMLVIEPLWTKKNLSPTSELSWYFSWRFDAFLIQSDQLQEGKIFIRIIQSKISHNNVTANRRQNHRPPYYGPELSTHQIPQTKVTKNVRPMQQ